MADALCQLIPSKEEQEKKEKKEKKKMKQPPSEKLQDELEPII